MYYVERYERLWLYLDGCSWKIVGSSIEKDDGVFICLVVIFFWWMVWWYVCLICIVGY